MDGPEPDASGLEASGAEAGAVLEVADVTDGVEAGGGVGVGAELQAAATNAISEAKDRAAWRLAGKSTAISSSVVCR